MKFQQQKYIKTTTNKSHPGFGFARRNFAGSDFSQFPNCNAGTKFKSINPH